MRFCSSGLNASSILVAVRTALNSAGLVVIVYSLALREPTESPLSRGHTHFLFGSRGEVWLGLQMEYDLAEAEKTAGKIKVTRVASKKKAYVSA